MSNITTDATTANLIAEYWNSVFLNELRANLVLEPLGLKNTHGKSSGTMVHWLGLTDLTAGAALTEATDPTAHTFSATDQTATVAQYGATVKISDLLQETWQVGSMQSLMERIARNASFTIDTVIRNAAMSDSGTAQYAGGAVARNSIATSGAYFNFDINEVRKAVRTLEGNSVPTWSDGFYVGVIHPNVKYDLQGDTANWQEILKNTETGYGTFQNQSAGMRPGGAGVVGTMFGVKFVMSQQAFNSAMGSASAPVYQSYISAPEHFGVSQLQNVQVIVKNPSPVSTLDLYGTIGWKAGFATKELEAKRMVRVESSVTA